jgi:hypothetical protein
MRQRFVIWLELAEKVSADSCCSTVIEVGQNK